MKISKHVHSCLVFEKEGFKLLIDPGKFSFAEELVSPEDFADVNAVIITHNHPDHLDKEHLQAILKLSRATIYTNAQVQNELQQAGIESKLLPLGDSTIGPFALHTMSVQHEALLDNPAPEMTAFVIDSKVLHPVDSFEDSLLQFQGIPLLLLPVMAPFTTELRIAAFADAIEPKQILPVHDGFAKLFFVKQRYQNYQQHFEKQGILFHQLLIPGDSISI
jgi:L-ascorbate metabolism protein UlaG (beta-lactamase superfamily)